MNSFSGGVTALSLTMAATVMSAQELTVYSGRGEAGGADHPVRARHRHHG